MEYYVVGPDGSKYGPASIDVLNGWIAEGRIVPRTMLVTEAGLNLMAMDVQGLVFPNAAPPTTSPGPYAQNSFGSQDYKSAYHRPMLITADKGGSEVIWAWVLGGVAILTSWVCCLLGLGSGIGGIVLAIIAKFKNQPTSLAALIFNIIALVLAIVGPFLVQMLFFRGFGVPSFD